MGRDLSRYGVIPNENALLDFDRHLKKKKLQAKKRGEFVRALKKRASKRVLVSRGTKSYRSRGLGSGLNIESNFKF